MKKGISLIVLVITIIVMIIIAGAIILSLNSSNVTEKANYAKVASDRANLQAELATYYAEYMGENYATDPDGSEFDATEYMELPTGFEVDSTNNLKIVYTQTLADLPDVTPDWYKGA